MKWLKKALWRWTYQGRELDEETATVSNRLIARDSEAMCGDEPVLNFKVYSAVGGKVVEFRRYDRKTDRSGSVTHVIPEGDDISTAIGHIVSMELLKQ